jgi:4,5-DOPA dioxygenase extradiol
MPVVFFGHGSPMNALEHNDVTRVWRQIGAEMPRPKAILCVSAHWETHGSAVTAMEQPRTIHDFGGFPPALFAMQYAAPGSPALAERVRALLLPDAALADHGWGLDHGTWSVLVHAYPAADIPVVQLSLDVALDGAGHYALARRLRALRDEGVLVIGSGNVVHNLRRMEWSAHALAQPWATRFDAWVRARIEARDHDALMVCASEGADARLAVPTAEHYLPLLYCLALQDDGDSVAFPVGGIAGGTISMLSVVIGTAPPA